MILSINDLLNSFTADVTPPRITFITNPRYTNENVTITWRYNEETTATCTLQTPDATSMIECDHQNVTLTELNGGSHTLYITATDIAGNVASVRHSWNVGK